MCTVTDYHKPYLCRVWITHHEAFQLHRVVMRQWHNTGVDAKLDKALWDIREIKPYPLGRKFEIYLTVKQLDRYIPEAPETLAAVLKDAHKQMITEWRSRKR